MVQNKNLQDFMYAQAKWSDATFGSAQRNPAIIHHLKKEVNELIEASDKYEKSKTDINALRALKEEYADCMILLLDSAIHTGLTADKLMEECRNKLEINKKRKWGKPDTNGVIEHVKEQEHVQVKEKKRINIYTCPKGHETITFDKDEGVTPFMIGCEHDECDESARSGFYKVDKEVEPTHEWHKPVSYDGLSDIEIDHVKQGGLLLRKIE